MENLEPVPDPDAPAEEVAKPQGFHVWEKAPGETWIWQCQKCGGHTYHKAHVQPPRDIPVAAVVGAHRQLVSCDDFAKLPKRTKPNRIEFP